eukprot:ANDGO_05695.mRNA.1 hypothetical protein (macronuclear)
MTPKIVSWCKSFVPIDATLLLNYARNHPAVSVVSKKIDRLTIHDLSVKDSNRFVSDDAAYASDPELWYRVARGNTIVEHDSVPSIPRIVSRGVRKFFDFQKDDSTAADDCSISTVVSTEKANGECARISYDTSLDAWFIGSKNVTLFADSRQHLDSIPMYKTDNRFNFAYQIAKVFFDMLEVKSQQDREKIKRLFSQPYTGVAEFISSNEHIVYYDRGLRNILRFFALVPIDGSETCLNPATSFAWLQDAGLPTVAYQSLAAADLECHVREVFFANFEQEGEGRVLYLVDQSGKVRHICKAKNQTYWILRAIREQLKRSFSPETMSQKIRSKVAFLELSDDQVTYWTRVAIDFGMFVKATHANVGNEFSSTWKRFQTSQLESGLLADSSSSAAAKGNLFGNSAVDVKAPDRTFVMFSGIPGCGKDSLAVEVAQSAGLSHSVWTRELASQESKDCVVISQDAFGDRQRCIDALIRSFQSPGIKFIFLTRNNFSPKDRSTWLDIGFRFTKNVYAIFPNELYDKSNPLFSVVLLLRSIDHVIRRANHPGKLDSSEDHGRCAYVSASFLNKTEIPTEKECMGVIGYDAMVHNQLLIDTVRSQDSSLQRLLSTVRSLPAFRTESTFVESKGAWIPSKSGLDGIAMMKAFVLPMLQSIPSSLDRPLSSTAADVWSRLQTLRPVPLYFGLFPKNHAMQIAALQQFLLNDLKIDLHGFNTNPLENLHVTLLYLGGVRPSGGSLEESILSELSSLPATDTAMCVAVTRVICSNEVVVCEVMWNRSMNRIPCANAYPHVTIGVRGKLNGRPTQAKDANELIHCFHERTTVHSSGGQFHNIFAVEIPVEKSFKLELTVKPVFAK